MTIELATPADATLVPGDHVCGFYYGEEERDALLLPFLREGFESGAKCVAVVDSTPPDEVVERIGGTPASVASGQLEFYDSDQTYLRGGAFDPDRWAVEVVTDDEMGATAARATRR